MKQIRQILADEGKVVSIDGKNYGKVIWCSEEIELNQISEITDEEWDGIKRVYEASQPKEFEDVMEVKPNDYYYHEGHRYVYVGMHDTIAENWESVAEDMEMFDEE